MQNSLFTSESVTEGHPDKICDKISDSVLDEIFKQDPHSRVACETYVTTGLVVIGGEVSTKAYVDVQGTARRAIQDIGYTSSEMGFDYKTCGVIVTLDEQSPDIAQGVDSKDQEGKEQGAGDQGLMFGFACDETEQLMPLPISLSHQLTQKLTDLRKSGTLPYLRPDGKAQVTVRYADGKPVEVTAIVVSTQHSDGISQDQIRNDLIEQLVKTTIPSQLISSNIAYHINPTGKFVIGGPHGDAGLTGRKIIVDTYGGMGRHGGGAFSGKDPSKVDRSAAYNARYIAKNIVAAKLASRCEVQLAYAIGVADPVSVSVDTFGTGKVDEEKISQLVRENFALKPKEITESLDLLRPIYAKTAAYGHFGRELPEFTWEKTDKADILRSKAGL